MQNRIYRVGSRLPGCTANYTNDRTLCEAITDLAWSLNNPDREVWIERWEPDMNVWVRFYTAQER